MWRRIGLIALGVLATAVLIGGIALIFARSEASVLSTTGALIVAAFIVIVAARRDIAPMVHRLGSARVLLSIITFEVTTSVIGPTEGTLQFDAIGAQVIAVLLLALAIDARFFQVRAGGDRLQVAGTCFVMLALAAGEYYALKGIFTGHPQHGEMVAAAIATGFVGIALTALAGPSRQQERERRDSNPRPPA